MKICLIGNGYWGNIIHKNLNKLGFKDIGVYDINLNNVEEINDTFDIFFITTPFSTHYDILKKLVRYKNKKIWCEKPLVNNMVQLFEIYDEMKANNNLLFVDWTYNFNLGIAQLREILKGKKLKQIILNRTNEGPVRFDCNSISDLSTHDLSILFYVFENKIFDFHFNEFSIDPNKKTGSNISWAYVDDIQIIINSSWEHKVKNRLCIFVCDNHELIIFDDIKKTLVYDGQTISFENEISPIENALTFFFKSQDFSANIKITEKITRQIEKYNAH